MNNTHTELLEWQPIETAPRDGRKILIKIDGKEIIAYWGKLHKWYVWDWVCEEYSNGTWNKATNWKDLNNEKHTTIGLIDMNDIENAPRLRLAAIAALIKKNGGNLTVDASLIKFSILATISLWFGMLIQSFIDIREHFYLWLAIATVFGFIINTIYLKWAKD